VEHPKVLNFVLVRRVAKQKFVSAILNAIPHVLDTTNKFFPVTLHDLKHLIKLCLKKINLLLCFFNYNSLNILPNSAIK